MNDTHYGQLLLQILVNFLQQVAEILQMILGILFQQEGFVGVLHRAQLLLIQEQLKVAPQGLLQVI